MQTIVEVGSAAQLLAVQLAAAGLSDWLDVDQGLIDNVAAATGTGGGLA